MARVCELTGKKAMVGNNVSHAMNKTKRRFNANLTTKRFYIPEEDRWITLKVSTSAIKTINKKGISAVLKEAKEKNKNLHIIGIINKIDRIKKEIIIEKIKELNDELEFDYIIPVSAMLREGISDILKRIEELLPKGPKYYSEDEYTDQTVREMCEEIIRGKALKLLNQEIPHGLYVEIESFKEAKTKKGEDIVNIETVIYTKKSTHKGIIVGKNGEMLKRIGSYARADIERMLDKKVNLQIWVKVRKNWLDNDLFLNRFKKK